MSTNAVFADGDAKILGDTRDGLIRSLIQKYHPGLTYRTGEVAVDDDYYGEWDGAGSVLVFTTACDDLNDEEMSFIVLHEIAHALSEQGHHKDRFYGVLTALVISEGVSWATAIRVEQMIPALWEKYLSSANTI